MKLNKILSPAILPSILLLLMAIVAILVASSPLKNLYESLLASNISIGFDQFVINKPLILWINDGFMAIFFLLIGLELKKEFISGIFKERKQIVLPFIGALGGILFPVIIYFLINHNDKFALNGWAIPAATDIAFAVGLLSLFGTRVNRELKMLLTSIAVFDDLVAVIIIAVFYTPNISMVALFCVLVCMVILFILNRLNITSLLIYLLIGIIMWVAMIKSGVHATLTGFILAFFIPSKSKKNDQIQPMHTLEEILLVPVGFFILPVFAFVNSGIDFSGIGFGDILHPIPLGIAIGLFIGKQLGVFLFCFTAVKCKFTFLPKGITWLQLYGISIITGIGFTMSLFIGSLAFDKLGSEVLFDERIGILMGSLLSAIVGYFVLKFAIKKISSTN